MKPTMLVVEMRNKSCLLDASRNIQSIGGNAKMNYRGAGNGPLSKRTSFGP